MAIEDYERLTADQQLPRAGLLILAIAKAPDLGVATRNVDHFRGFGVPVYDPFDDIQIF